MARGPGEEAGRAATERELDDSVPIERRLVAIGVDVALLLAACVAMLMRFTTVAGERRGVSGAIAAIGVALLFVLEATTGLTPGKLLAGLRLSAASASTRAARAAIKYFPVGLFGLGLVASSPVTDACWWIAAVIVQVYATVYYFAVARRGCSAFDLPVGTRITRASISNPESTSAPGAESTR